MSEGINTQTKKKIMKDIIRKLHKGLSVEEAKERFEKEVGSITSTEIAEIEQSLINEGLSSDEIKKFCNVHALLFQSALEKTASDEMFPSHPVYLFKLENREIEKHLNALQEIIEKRDEYELQKTKERFKELLTQLKDIEVHFTRKEQVLFPFLEKKGFFGPSKVMWGKDDEIREFLKKAVSNLNSVNKNEELEEYVKDSLNPLIEEINGMIFKEENILYPTSLEKLSAEDWVEILKDSDEVGYVFIESLKETEALMKDFKKTLLEEPAIGKEQISLPTGSFTLKELMSTINTLPVDITFVDKEDRVKFFSESKDRIFVRTKSVIGRKVQNCHPPQSVDVVEKILKSFKEGKKDFFDFWINFKGRFILIRYFAVRSKEGEYLGTLEVTQDVTELKNLEGEKRLLDERG